MCIRDSLGAALKRAREEKGWTQAYVAELVDRDSRTIMNIENKGQYPSFDPVSYTHLDVYKRQAHLVFPYLLVNMILSTPSYSPLR